MHLWQQPKCQTANDLPRLQRLLRLRTDEEREALEMVISEFFNVKDSFLFSKRLSIEFQKANELSKTRSRAGKAGGRPRKHAQTQAQHGEREETNSFSNDKQMKTIEGKGKGIYISPPLSPNGDSPPQAKKTKSVKTICPWVRGQEIPNDLQAIAQQVFEEITMPVPWPSVLNAFEEFIEYRTERAPASQRKLTDWASAYRNDLKTKISNGYFNHVQSHRLPQTRPGPAYQQRSRDGAAQALADIREFAQARDPANQRIIDIDEFRGGN